MRVSGFVDNDNFVRCELIQMNRPSHNACGIFPVGFITNPWVCVHNVIICGTICVEKFDLHLQCMPVKRKQRNVLFMLHFWKNVSVHNLADIRTWMDFTVAALHVRNDMIWYGKTFDPLKFPVNFRIENKIDAFFRMNRATGWKTLVSQRLSKAMKVK